MLIKIERLMLNGVIQTIALGAVFIIVGALTAAFAGFSLFTNKENLGGAFFFTFGGIAMVFLGWQAIAEKAKELKRRNIKY